MLFMYNVRRYIIFEIIYWVTIISVVCLLYFVDVSEIYIFDMSPVFDKLLGKNVLSTFILSIGGMGLTTTHNITLNLLLIFMLIFNVLKRYNYILFKLYVLNYFVMLKGIYFNIKCSTYYIFKIKGFAILWSMSEFIKKKALVYFTLHLDYIPKGLNLQQFYQDSGQYCYTIYELYDEFVLYVEKCFHNHPQILIDLETANTIFAITDISLLLLAIIIYLMSLVSLLPAFSIWVSADHARLGRYIDHPLREAFRNVPEFDMYERQLTRLTVEIYWWKYYEHLLKGLDPVFARGVHDEQLDLIVRLIDHNITEHLHNIRVELENIPFGWSHFQQLMKKPYMLLMEESMCPELAEIHKRREWLLTAKYNNYLEYFVTYERTKTAPKISIQLVDPMLEYRGGILSKLWGWFVDLLEYLFI